jgi:phage terminase small subunit
MSELSKKQQLFVKYYLVSLNSADAARKAKYSSKTAKEQGCRLLTNVHIKKAIEKEQDRLTEKIQIDQEWVLNKSVKIVTVGLAEKVSKNGDIDLIDANNANKALDRIAKKVGGFRDQLDVTGDISINVNTGMEGVPGSGVLDV